MCICYNPNLLYLLYLHANWYNLRAVCVCVWVDLRVEKTYFTPEMIIFYIDNLVNLEIFIIAYIHARIERP